MVSSTEEKLAQVCRTWYHDDQENEQSIAWFLDEVQAILDQEHTEPQTVEELLADELGELPESGWKTAAKRLRAEVAGLLAAGEDWAVAVDGYRAHIRALTQRADLMEAFATQRQGEINFLKGRVEQLQKRLGEVLKRARDAEAEVQEMELEQTDEEGIEALFYEDDVTVGQPALGEPVTWQTYTDEELDELYESDNDRWCQIALARANRGEVTWLPEHVTIGGCRVVIDPNVDRPILLARGGLARSWDD